MSDDGVLSQEDLVALLRSRAAEMYGADAIRAMEAKHNNLTWVEKYAWHYGIDTANLEEAERWICFLGQLWGKFMFSDCEDGAHLVMHLNRAAVGTIAALDYNAQYQAIAALDFDPEEDQ